MTDNRVMLQPFPEEAEEEIRDGPDTTASSKRVGTRTKPPSTAPATASQSIAHIGRPIAQVSAVPDPVSTIN